MFGAVCLRIPYVALKILRVELKDYMPLLMVLLN